MRIALVVTGGVDRSGRERVIPVLLSLIERLARDHEVTVYALRYHDQPCSYPLLGATVRDLGRPEGLARQYGALVEGLRLDGPFDVIHAYWAVPAGLVAACAGRRLGVPVVVTADSGEFVAAPDIGYGLQRLWRHRLAVAAALRLAARVTVCTRFMERLARAHGLAPAILPIGVDREVFRPADPSSSVTVSTGRGTAHGPWRVLHVASLNPVKDQAMLMEAFRHVVDRAPSDEVHLDVVGEDTLSGAVQTRARALALEAHVTFHGPLPTPALVALYQQAHLFVLSSRHEAAAVVALEAAACGVPVVGTAVGYLADWSPDRAVTIPARDARALGDAVIDLLRDPARRAALASAARAWALEHDADWTAARFVELYESLQQPRA